MERFKVRLVQSSSSGRVTTFKGGVCDGGVTWDGLELQRFGVFFFLSIACSPARPCKNGVSNQRAMTDGVVGECCGS